MNQDLEGKVMARNWILDTDVNWHLPEARAFSLTDSEAC